MSADRLEVRHVSKRYGAVEALVGVSFAVAPSEIHALLGENGAGKSTLVKIITGLVAQDAGDDPAQSLPDYLDRRIAASMGKPIRPDPRDVAGFEEYFARHRRALTIEAEAVRALR